MKEQLNNNLQVILGLEWLGIRIEDVKEESDSLGLTEKAIYYYSVPESSTVEVDDEELNTRIKTSDGLKHLAKEILLETLIAVCRAIFPDDEEFLEYVEEDISNIFKFKAKVRIGETWTKEMGDNRVKELYGEIQQASQYSEV